jgi:hypothetical protein
MQTRWSEQFSMKESLINLRLEKTRKGSVGHMMREKDGENFLAVM